MSSDAPSFFGIGAGAQRLRIYADEVPQWQKRDLWAAAVSTLPKFADSQLVALGNAGISGTWPEEARALIAEGGGYLYASPVIPSWISAEALAHAERSLLPSE